MPAMRPAAARAPRRGRAAAALASALVTVLGCAVPLSATSRYDYFVTPDPGDAWSAKIAGWQVREAAEAVHTPEIATPSVDGAGGSGTATLPPAAAPPESAPAPTASLRVKYAAFRAQHKRELAQELFDWIQAQAKLHYIPDGPIDHWATLEETLKHNGDDCDGLELLVYNALRELGFSDHEVYRAIVYRPSDGQHHMVTFWFEQPNDPWVIDPTGAMTSRMLHMSQIPDWVPLKLFDEKQEFTVRRVLERPSLAAR